MCVCLNVFSAEYGIWEHSKNPQLKEADTDASFFSWRVNSFEQPRAVFVQDQEVFGFMSQGKFHFVPYVAYGIEHIQKGQVVAKVCVPRVSRIAREDL